MKRAALLIALLISACGGSAPPQGDGAARPGAASAVGHTLIAKKLQSIKRDAASHDVVLNDPMKMPRCCDVQAVARLEAKK